MFAQKWTAHLPTSIATIALRNTLLDFVVPSFLVYWYHFLFPLCTLPLLKRSIHDYTNSLYNIAEVSISRMRILQSGPSLKAFQLLLFASIIYGICATNGHSQP